MLPVGGTRFLYCSVGMEECESGFGRKCFA
jgi:hypothetical protein